MHRCDIGNYLREYKTAGVNNVGGIEFHSLIVNGKKKVKNCKFWCSVD